MGTPSVAQSPPGPPPGRRTRRPPPGGRGVAFPYVRLTAAAGASRALNAPSLRKREIFYGATLPRWAGISCGSLTPISATPLDRIGPSAYRRMPPSLARFDQKRSASHGFPSHGHGRLVLKAEGQAHGRVRVGAVSRSTGPPHRRAPARHGPQPAPTATSFRHGLHGAFFFGGSEHFHLLVGGTSPLVGGWAPLPRHRLRVF